MSQAQLPNELATFLENWTTDPQQREGRLRPLQDFLLTTPDVRFVSRPAPA
ncbi:MAG: hypothetical protein ACLSAH_04735 [Bilophila wadsworthia]